MNTIERRPLGRTGLSVTRLGVGLSQIGGAGQDATAGRVLNAALDAGLNFLDTSACYGRSEEVVGHAVSHRRDEFVLATKCGHVTGGYQGRDWTPRTVADSIDRSLRRLKTDVIDLVQLHSCEVDVLERGDVVDVLLAARDAGKTRFIGYSGDNEAAAWAVDSGLFDTLQTSFNVVDQRARRQLFDRARAQGMGIIVKRPIANGAWGATASPSGYAQRYFERSQEMLADGPVAGAPDDRIWLALGFVLAHPAVDTAIVGTGNPAHMRANIDLVSRATPLSGETVTDLHERFERHGRHWPQLR